MPSKHSDEALEASERVIVFAHVHAGWLSPDLKAFNTNVEILGKDWEQRACWEDVYSGYGLFLDHIFPLILFSLNCHVSCCSML